MKRNEFWKRSLAGFDFWRDPGDAKFYPKLANWACDFFPRELTFTAARWAGKPFVLQDWQKQIAGHLFAWIKPDGTRRFRKLFLYIPRKNGKTEFAAGLGLMFFVADNEPNAEVYCGSLTKSQANIFFSKVKRMVHNNPMLCERIQPPKGRTSRTLYDAEADGKLAVLASDDDAAQGFNCSCAVIDEIHTLKDDGAFVGALQESMGARDQPMTIEMTTAADPGENFCNRELAIAEQVRDGKISDPSLMPVVFAAPAKCDISDPKVWKAANPSCGVTVPLSYFDDQYRKLSRTTIGLIRFKKYYLNMQTSRNECWLDQSYWEQCKTTPDKVILDDEDCVLGLDRSQVSDISALGRYYPKLALYDADFVVPEETAGASMAYEQWAADGFLRVSEQRAISDDELFDMVEGAAEKYNVIALAYDPWRMTDLALKIAKPKSEGGLGIRCVPILQSYKELSKPINDVEIAVRNGILKHLDNPVLNWMFSNCRIEKDHKENVKIVKESPTSPKKIDGIITLVMAHKLAMQIQNEPKTYRGGVEMI